MTNTKFQYVCSFDLLNFVMFLITIYIYIDSVQKLKLSITDIVSGITLPIYTNNYFSKIEKINFAKKHIVDNIDNPSEQDIKRLLVNINICVEQTLENIEWINLQKVLNLEWDSFQIFGIQITDTALIQKIISVIVTVSLASDLSSLISF